MQYYLESKQAGKIDNMILFPLMKWEDEKVPLSLPILEGIKMELERR